ARDLADGRRSEDVGAQPVPAVARRQEPVRRGREQPRQRVLPEPDVDDHGPRLALLRPPGRPAQEGGAMTDDARVSGLSRRDALKLAAGAALIAPLSRLASPAAAAAADAPPRYFSADELALVDELTEMIIPKDDHSPGAREAKCAAFIDFMLAEG